MFRSLSAGNLQNVTFAAGATLAASEINLRQASLRFLGGGTIPSGTQANLSLGPGAYASLGTVALSGLYCIQSSGELYDSDVTVEVDASVIGCTVRNTRIHVLQGARLDAGGNSSLLRNSAIDVSGEFAIGASLLGDLTAAYTVRGSGFMHFYSGKPGGSTFTIDALSLSIADTATLSVPENVTAQFGNTEITLSGNATLALSSASVHSAPGLVLTERARVTLNGDNTVDRISAGDNTQWYLTTVGAATSILRLTSASNVREQVSVNVTGAPALPQTYRWLYWPTGTVTNFSYASITPGLSITGANGAGTSEFSIASASTTTTATITTTGSTATGSAQNKHASSLLLLCLLMLAYASY